MIGAHKRRPPCAAQGGRFYASCLAGFPGVSDPHCQFLVATVKRQAGLLTYSLPRQPPSRFPSGTIGFRTLLTVTGSYRTFTCFPLGCKLTFPACRTLYRLFQLSFNLSQGQICVNVHKAMVMTGLRCYNLLNLCLNRS